MLKAKWQTRIAVYALCAFLIAGAVGAQVNVSPAFFDAVNPAFHSLNVVAPVGETLVSADLARTVVRITNPNSDDWAWVIRNESGLVGHREVGSFVDVDGSFYLAQVVDGSQEPVGIPWWVAYLPLSGWQFQNADGKVVSVPDAQGTVALSLSGTTGSIGGSLLPAAGSCETGTAAVTGSIKGMPVIPSTSDGSLPSPLVKVDATVTADGTVTVQVCALASVTPASKTWNVRVIQ